MLKIKMKTLNRQRMKQGDGTTHELIDRRTLKLARRPLGVPGNICVQQHS